MFALTAPYIVHLLKVHCYSIYLVKLYKLNARIVHPSLYLIIKTSICILKILLYCIHCILALQLVSSTECLQQHVLQCLGLPKLKLLTKTEQTLKLKS